MIKYDIQYLSDSTDFVEAPLKVTGKASGEIVIIQQFLNLLLAPSDNLRLFGGNVLGLLKGTNNNIDYVASTINYAAANTLAFMKQNGVGLLQASVSDIALNADTANVRMALNVNTKPVEISFQLPTKE